MLIGYIRAKADDASALSKQRRVLQDVGCKEIVEDVASGSRWSQPELRRLLDRLERGDVIVVARLGSLGPSLQHVARMVHQLQAAGLGVRSLGEAIDTTARSGRAAMRIIDSLAAFDRDAARERIGVGLAAARAEGRVGGRPPKLTAGEKLVVVDAVLSGRRSAADMARLHNVSQATISRLVAARRAGPAILEAGQPEDADADPAGKIVGVLPFSALDGRLAIVGTSGSGKTYAAKGLVERLMDGGGRVCVVDPLGVWWGLRAAADGAAAGYPVVVFGGLHADIALDDGMGAALGRLLGTHPLACVVDLSEMGSSAARRLFMTAFAEALHQVNTAPLHLVLDEADLWAPQRAQPDGQDLLGRVEEIVRRGRVRGFVPWLITQRPAVLHKDVLSQADILLSMKLTSSQDREAIGRWIEGQADRADGRRILAELPQLARGEGYLWAPSDGILTRVKFPLIRTFDSSRTPQRDERIPAPRTLAAVDVSALSAALAEMGAFAPDRDADPARSRRSPAPGLEQRMRQMDRELAATRTRMAEMEAEAAVMRARLEQAVGRDAHAASAAPLRPRAAKTTPRRRGAAAAPRRAERTDGEDDASSGGQGA